MALALSERLAAALKDDRLRRIVVVRPDRVGDLLWATPALGALRRRFPRAHLAVLASAYARDVVDRSPDVDAVLAVETGGLAPARALARRGAVRCLQAGAFDLALAPTRAGADLARRAGIPFVVGTGPGLDGELADPWSGHEAARDMALAVGLGAEAAPLRPSFPVRADERRWAATYLADRCIDAGAPLLGIHPGCQRWVRRGLRGRLSGAGHRWKLWPPERHAAVARRFVKATGGCVLVTGLAAERPLVEAIVRGVGPGALAVLDAAPLGRLAALIERLAVLVAPDTGPMHLAAALGTPLVALLGPTSPDRTGPLPGPGPVALVRHPFPCSPCAGATRRACRTQPCMAAIGVDEVLEAALRLAAGD